MEGGEVSFIASRYNTMRVIVWLALGQTREKRKRVRSPALDFDRKILKRFLEPSLTGSIIETALIRETALRLHTLFHFS